MYYLGFEASNTIQLIEAPVAGGASQAGHFNSKVLLAHILNKVYQQTDIKIKVIRSSNIFSS